MIILRQNDIVVPEGFAIVTQEKELGFDQKFVVHDASKAHKTGNVKVLLGTNNTKLA